MSNIEDYIKGKRQQLDTHDPNLEGMWAKVEAELDPPTRKIEWRMWLGVAAAACIVFVAGFWSSDPNIDFVETQHFEEPIPMHEIDPVMAQEESNLLNEFNEKQVLLANYELENQDLVFFVEELAKIDTLDVELRAKIGRVKNQKKLLQSILDNYKKRIRIVDQMIREIEKKERREKRKNGSYV